MILRCGYSYNSFVASHVVLRTQNWQYQIIYEIIINIDCNYI